MIEHVSFFKYASTDEGFIRCIAHIKYKAEFEKMGFVDHPDKMKKPGRRKKVDSNKQRSLNSRSLSVDENQRLDEGANP